MSQMEQEQSGFPPSSEPQENQGFMHIEAKDDAQEESTTLVVPQSVPVADTQATVKQATTGPARSMERAGTLEHLAARRPIAALNPDTPEMKQRLSELRTEITSILTDFRWSGLSIEEAAERLTPLLNLGPIPQWRLVLIPFLLEIDRAGNLIPVWVHIIEQDDPRDLPPNADPAETMQGRAKRYGILMLGHYKYVHLGDERGAQRSDLATFLGQLATNPTTSLYATQSLVKQGTTAAIQALIEALKDAEGWAKVDIVEACIALNLTRFYDLLLASGLDRVSGLESYVAVPLYRTLSLEKYLLQDTRNTPRLGQQAALVFAQILQDGTTPPAPNVEALPVVFERPLFPQAQALFTGARKTPNWQYTIALHRLALFMGRYWSDVSRSVIQDQRILEQVYPCFAMMPDVERWMDGPGRDVLLKSLNDAEEAALIPIMKVLGELGDPRATSILIGRLDSTRNLTNREQALYVGTICDTLGRLGDQRAISPMLQLLQRTVAVSRRTTLDKRRDNLLAGDPAIPESIVYAAVIRACGLLGDSSTLDNVLLAANDFDPYVRMQALDALKRLDMAREDARSRMAIREALNDPRESIVRTACQLVVQYHNTDAIPTLRHLIENRPELAPAAYDALRQLGQ